MASYHAIPEFIFITAPRSKQVSSSYLGGWGGGDNAVRRSPSTHFPVQTATFPHPIQDIFEAGWGGGSAMRRMTDNRWWITVVGAEQLVDIVNK